MSYYPLVKTMFSDPKPKFNGYGCDFYHGQHCVSSPCFCRKEAKEDRNAWKRRQVKPEDNRTKKWAESYEAEYSKIDLEYQEELEYYNANRLRYGGFERYRRSNHVEFIHKSSNKLSVTFWLDGSVDISAWDLQKEEPIFEFNGRDQIGTQLFELICKENGIKLETL